MAFNPYFPSNYQNPYMQQYQPQQQSGGLIWVQGESGYYPYMGRSYQRRDMRGRYSRENRGYSRDDARDSMIHELREIMQDAPDDHTKKRFQSFIRELENA